MEYTSYTSNQLSFSKYLSKCFLWMFLGLIITFVTAVGFSYTGLLENLLLSFGMGFIILFAVIEVVKETEEHVKTAVNTDVSTEVQNLDFKKSNNWTCRSSKIEL